VAVGVGRVVKVEVAPPMVFVRRTMMAEEQQQVRPGIRPAVLHEMAGGSKRRASRHGGGGGGNGVLDGVVLGRGRRL
jgi:hypothetical protein